MTAISGNGEITLTWDSCYEAISYDIYYAKNSGVSKNKYELKISGITSNLYIHKGLTNDITYYYIIIANNIYGQSDNSKEVNATPAIPPSAPAFLNALPAGDSKIDLFWQPLADSTKVKGYYIYRDGVKIDSTSINTYRDINLNSKTKYNYSISAYDFNGNVSQQTNKVSSTTLGNPVYLSGEITADTIWQDEYIIIIDNVIIPEDVKLTVNPETLLHLMEIIIYLLREN
ncbi:hypothetical protein HY745_02630 [Candidatus Desantisbacteria bacterium]|nr:hypothetical protein [Candidatus Desantisbacteria bacterium]